MPNHFHFLIQETTNKGTSSFISNFQNSYAKYFNTKNKRNGSLFQQMFKSVLIETDEQLLHIARYIHLNPLTSFILKDIDELSSYPWSSFQEYIGTEAKIVDKKLILNLFPSINHFIEFTKDQIDYQRQLDKIKHLTFE
jgi:putative transposase